MTPLGKTSRETPEPVIQRAADGTWVTMGSHTVQSIGGVDAAKAFVTVVAHRIRAAPNKEPDLELVKRIRVNPAETLRLLSDIAMFHSQIPNLRAFIEEQLAAMPPAKGKGRPRVAEKLREFRSFDAVRKYLVSVYRKAGMKAPVKAADEKANELLGTDFRPATAARYRRRLRKSER